MSSGRQDSQVRTHCLQQMPVGIIVFYHLCQLLHLGLWNFPNTTLENLGNNEKIQKRKQKLSITLALHNSQCEYLDGNLPVIFSVFNIKNITTFLQR